MTEKLPSKTDIEAAKIFQQVEDFSRKIREMDYSIDPKAERFIISYRKTESGHLGRVLAWLSPPKKASLAGMLAVSMAEYEQRAAEYELQKREYEHAEVPRKEASPLEITLMRTIEKKKAEALAQKFQIKVLAAETCLIWIDRAFTSGFIKESESLARKLRECIEKRTELERQLHKAHQSLQELQRNYDGLDKLLKRQGKGGPSFTSEVKGGE